MVHWRPDCEDPSVVSDVPSGWIPVGRNADCSEEAAYLHSTIDKKKRDKYFIVFKYNFLFITSLNLVSFFPKINIRVLLPLTRLHKVYKTTVMLCNMPLS